MQEIESTPHRWYTYIRYFCYLTWGWGIRLAWFVVKRELVGERQLGHYSCGIDTLHQSVSAADRMHASIYQPVNFYTAEKLFGYLALQETLTGFLDAGCGKGRVLAMAAAHGFTSIYGFDISAAMIYDAIRSTSYLRDKNDSIILQIDQANAINYPISSGVGVIFLFNPFDGLIMEGFIKNVLVSLASQPRPMTILYANPVHKSSWIHAGFEEQGYFLKMKYLEGSVLRYVPKKGA